MSKETISWLNENTMIGNINDKAKWTKNAWAIIDPKTGTMKAWWQQDDFENAYEGFIPVEEVERVLFNWTPVEATIFLRKPCSADEADGVDGYGNSFVWVPDPESKAIMHPETNHVYNYFGANSYQVHGYSPWLIDNVAKIAGGEVGVDTAGLLREGGVAYVSLSLSEGITTDAGLEFRPSILASTSIDGTKATTYSAVNTIAVCDNSMAAAEQGASGRFKIKHTAKSLRRVNDVRDALGIIYQTGENFGKMIDTMVNIDVTDSEFARIIRGLVETPEPIVSKGKITNQRAITIAEGKFDDMWNMWSKDVRAAPWNGTLLGAMQTVNTYNEHYRSRNDNQVERVMTGTLNGTFDKMDQEFWSVVADIETINLKSLVGVK